MRRGIVLGVLLATGALSLAAAGYQGQANAPKTIEVEKLPIKDEVRPLVLKQNAAKPLGL